MVRIFRVICVLAALALLPMAMADPPADVPRKPNIFDFGRPDTAPSAPTTREIPGTTPSSASASQPATDAVVIPPPSVVPPPPPPIVNRPAAPPAKPEPVAAAQVVQHPVPPASAITEKLKQVNEIFGPEITRAITTEQKIQLSAKLMQAGVDENSDLAAKFAIFRRATDLCIAAGDLETACGLIDQIGENFSVDVPKLKSDAVVAIGKSPHTEWSSFADQARALSDAALVVDEYDLASVSMQQALSAARRLNDQTSIKDINARLRRLTAIQTAYNVVKPAEVLLATKPNDPDANLKSGRFRCFMKGEWAIGLPRLAIGNDLHLKMLASKELQDDTDKSARFALADGWWDAAEKETGIAKIRIHSHASAIYDKIIAGLSGLGKARVEKRISDSAAEGFGPRVVNLLRLLDLDNDVCAGDWEFKDGILSCDAKLLPVVQFPYQPPEEYDYRIVFVRKSGNNEVSQVCYAGGHQFAWLMGGKNDSRCGLQMYDDRQLGPDNPTLVEGSQWLTNGQPMISIVKVRKTGIQSFLNGKLVEQWKTDYHELSLRADNRLHLQTALGLNTWDSATEFRTVEVTEISGQGKLLR